MLANVQQTTIRPIIEGVVAPGSCIHTDEYSIYARLTHLVRNPGMVPNETICGVRRFHRVVFQRCVRCPPILHESFKKLE